MGDDEMKGKKRGEKKREKMKLDSWEMKLKGIFSLLYSEMDTRSSL